MHNIKLSNTYNLEYYIDDDNQIYILSELNDQDLVKEFLENNLTKITRDEIEDNMSDIIDEYEENNCLTPKLSWCDETYYDYEYDENYIHLQDLLENLDDAIVIAPNDVTYNKFLEEMRVVYAK